MFENALKYIRSDLDPKEHQDMMDYCMKSVIVFSAALRIQGISCPQLEVGILS
jgi:hypothetical protein